MSDPQTATVLPIVVCLKLTNEVAYSQPEAVVGARGALARLMLRERNRQRRTLLQGYAHHYKVDAAKQYPGLDAGAVVFDAISRMLALGSVKERLTHDGYIVGIDFGLLQMINSGRYMSCHAREALLDAFNGLPIRVLYDAAYNQYPGTGVPGVEPFAADLPKPGPGNAVELPGWPTGTPERPLCIEVFNPDDFDTFSVPDITMRGTRTFDDMLQNLVTALFLETFEGMMKPGCNPNFTMKFCNLKPTGAYVGCLDPGALPEGWCPGGDPLVADNDDDPATPANESQVDSGSGQIDQTGDEPNPDDASWTPGGVPAGPGVVTPGFEG